MHNLKKDIIEYDDRYDILFDNLKPRTYKYIFGASGRTHNGYITQDVENALEIAGLTTMDFGGVNIMPITCTEKFCLNIIVNTTKKQMKLNDNKSNSKIYQFIVPLINNLNFKYSSTYFLNVFMNMSCLLNALIVILPNIVSFTEFIIGERTMPCIRDKSREQCK